MKNNFKIAIVAGGTGGHIFPAISLLEQLINEKKEIIFFSDTRVRNITNENKSLFKKKNVTFYSLRISRNPKDFFNFFKLFPIYLSLSLNMNFPCLQFNILLYVIYKSFKLSSNIN